MSQNYPNPFNPVTQFQFGISKSGFVSLKVYDALGKEVAVMVNEKLSPGSYDIEFNGADLPSGVYYYKLESANFNQTRKMLILK
ncbi:MAG TPA: T9SS type A sorting domain-containing protein [Ignavibacteria bacterium]|nr:T9SS type A sorting domain-containing protein [Ignavibacteria bacterium]